MPIISAEFAAETDALLSWLRDAALPFWAEMAIDSKGGFFEDLALDGTPNTDAVRRVRVQARQIFVYANAHKAGWYDSTAILDRLYDFLMTYGYRPDGAAGFVHRIGPDYTVTDAKRDLYDHAFYLLACASLMGCDGATKHDEAAALTDTLLDFIDVEMGACTGWTEGVPAVLPRRQNPHMHLFETSMALYDVTGESRFMDRAARIYRLFTDHFFDADNHIIREFFDNDWTYADGALGQTAEPGHACEWVWLLGQYEARSGVDTRCYADALYARAFENGGVFLNDEEDVNDAVRRDTKRLWVQTEVIRAHLAQMEYGNKDAQDKAVAAMAAFRESYLNPNGTWNDQFDGAGGMIATTIPTSTFYHIYGMITEAVRIKSLGP
ncbi:AGE family epimerase/isomerase [Fretibacter rubidus]|uniref:AGE family epimerase/isomerase n=1 Tax=Fretibacter rubidus TaxID=570162 RepID=UPI00352AA0F9